MAQAPVLLPPFRHPKMAQYPTRRFAVAIDDLAIDRQCGLGPRQHVCQILAGCLAGLRQHTLASLPPHVRQRAFGATGDRGPDLALQTEQLFARELAFNALGRDPVQDAVENAG